MAQNMEGRQDEGAIQQTERDLELEAALVRAGARVVISHEAMMNTSEDYRRKFLAAQAGAAALMHEESD